MNSIEQAIRDLDPDYQITPRQYLTISQTNDPYAIAAVLPEQVKNNRQAIAQELGVDVEHVTNGDGLSAAHLSTPVTAQRSNNPMHVARKVSPDRLMEIGRRSVDIPKPDPLRAVYWAVLKREPDAEGLASWRGHYDDGMPLSEIVGYIERSDEATR